MNYVKPTVIALFSFLCCLSHAGTTAYQITGSVKTVENNKGDRKDLPRGSVQKVEKEQVLKLQLRRINPNIGENATVEWVVVMETDGGNPFLGTYGAQPIHSNVGIPVDLQSDAFTLKETSFNGDGKLGNASREQDVKGYGVRVLDAEGNEIGTKFQPSSIEADARKVFDLKAAENEKKSTKQDARRDRQDNKMKRRMK